ncbi:hypothetical protein [Salinicola peritrichatus]|uniref:SRPBCC family protein n=1 Tax=Salinicola peritrichatus TaxID=1267424 RepID=UPI000DA11835|nr:hypothetical protein [Salinicola peritrichatus]
MSSESQSKLTHTKKQYTAEVKGAERWISLCGGLWGMGRGLKKGGIGGWGQAIVSGMLLYRAVKGECRIKGALVESPHEKQVARQQNWRAARAVSHSVTVAKPRSELYRFWRTPENLTTFLVPSMNVEIIDDHTSRWTLDQTPSMSGVTVRVVEEREGEYIAWVAESETLPPFSGWIRFREAPGKLGTEIQGYVTYEPPKGRLGYVIDKWSRGGASQLLNENLRRFKQLVETGEVTTSRFHLA